MDFPMQDAVADVFKLIQSAFLGMETGYLKAD